ncbi:hypothetical protein [Embleya sp. NPDC050493]|uniref:hypothetical protein n=1 Tax=Embleya sp. NPDC050493 TaxID=3363989 RepID=UPI003797E7DB
MEFEEQLANLPFDQLHAKIVLEWALTPEERAEDRAQFERLRSAARVRRRLASTDGRGGRVPPPDR